MIAANAAAIPEICGEAALYFQPHDATGHAALMIRVVSDTQLRNELKRKGRNQLAKYSWEATARNYLAVLESSDPTTTNNHRALRW